MDYLAITHNQGADKGQTQNRFIQKNYFSLNGKEGRDCKGGQKGQHRFVAFPSHGQTEQTLKGFKIALRENRTLPGNCSALKPLPLSLSGHVGKFEIRRRTNWAYAFSHVELFCRHSAWLLFRPLSSSSGSFMLPGSKLRYVVMLGFRVNLNIENENVTLWKTQHISSTYRPVNNELPSSASSNATGVTLKSD